MRVLVTGGTGFVGCHTVAALIRAGHTVRLLVRNPARVEPALAPLGVGSEAIRQIECISGDVTHPDQVEQALHGCDAVIHAASVYSSDPRQAATIRATNVRGTEVVLGTAQRLGLAPIVHVSSNYALVGGADVILSPESPPTAPPGVYARSKADSDRVARRFQVEGAPVVITYPGGVFGPHDPYCGETCQLVKQLLRWEWTVTIKGQVIVTDVRDLAQLHRAVLEAEPGPHRYMAPSTVVSPREMIGLVSRITGRTLPAIALPPAALAGPVWLLSRLRRLVPLSLTAANDEAFYFVGQNHGWDDSATKQAFGLVPRPLEITLTDTIRWMAAAGHVSPARAGRLATDLRPQKA